MLGDGQTAYDQAHDGHANSLGSCQANFRRTNVITKLKITYVKDAYLDVRLHTCVVLTLHLNNRKTGQGPLPSLCATCFVSGEFKLTNP